jgi:hypothetical protein
VLLGSSQPAEASPVEAEKTDIARPRFQSLDGISVLKLRNSGSGDTIAPVNSTTSVRDKSSRTTPSAR